MTPEQRYQREKRHTTGMNQLMVSADYMHMIDMAVITESVFLAVDFFLNMEG
jgi:hypothetical protein